MTNAFILSTYGYCYVSFITFFKLIIYLVVICQYGICNEYLSKLLLVGAIVLNRNLL